MSATCPCCRQAVPVNADLLVDQDAGMLVRNGRIAALTKQQFALFEAIRLAFPRVKSPEALLREMYLHEQDEAGIKIVDVQICKMRARLKPLGVQIETLRGRGYRFVPPKTSSEAA